ncbi:MAG TPA: DNA polymerase III subunit gamma/tau [bacterium]|nr:DNA polymerase III subunit gamma/tau [bacterium]
MSYLVIARKWRPQTFEDVVGQSHVTRTLQNAITAGRVAHAYLFTGPRGVGKTTTARILAKALNCEQGPTAHPCLKCPACLEIAGPGSVDVIEIDGASNNGVDDIRSLREKVMYTGIRDRHKVYIIDEVHMLTNAAFNALLKTLEEPPPHVVFILATTEAQKMPATILSRTQRFDFRRVGAGELAEQLGGILKAEGLEASGDALQMVARAGGGSVRDSQTLLDQVISFALGDGEKRALRAEDVLAVLGGVQEGQALAALRSALLGQAPEALAWLQQQYQRGADPRQVLEAFQSLLRGLLLLKASPQAGAETELLPETVAALSELAPDLGLSRIFSAIKAAQEAEQQLRHLSQTRLVLELFLLKLGPASPGASLGEIVDELRDLEQRFLAGPAALLPPVPSGAAVALAAASGQAFVATQGAAPAANALVPAVPTTEPEPQAPVAAAPAVPSPAAIIETAPVPAENRSNAGVPAPAVAELEESAPAPTAAGKSVTVEAVKAVWEAVVQSVQDASLTLASAAKDAVPQAIEGGVLTLLAVNSFQRKVLDDPAERGRLEQALSSALGQPLRVRVLMAQPKAAGPRGGKPGAEEVERLLRQQPQIGRLKELFDAEIVEIRHED